MFEMIFEVARMTTRKRHPQTRAVFLKKAKKLIEVRPIEVARKAAGNETGSDQNKEDFQLEDFELLFERYDNRGNIKRHQSKKNRTFGKIV